MRRVITPLFQVVLLVTVIALGVSASVAAATKEPIEMTVFIPSSDVTTVDGKCQLNYGSSPVLRLEGLGSGSSQTIVTMSLRNGTQVTSDNKILPGTSGCIITKTVTLDPTNDYSVSLGEKEIATLKASTLAESDSLAMILTVDGVSIDSADQWLLPTPTPSPSPTPTPIPAGDQGNGTFLLRGYMVLYDEDAIVLADTCRGAGGYSDIGSGVQVVIRDGNNNVMGVGELVSTDGSVRGAGCSFEFEVKVKKADFYQLEISHRTGLVYTFDDLEELDWTIYISLGS